MSSWSASWGRWHEWFRKHRPSIDPRTWPSYSIRFHIWTSAFIWSTVRSLRTANSISRYDPCTKIRMMCITNCSIPDALFAVDSTFLFSPSSCVWNCRFVELIHELEWEGVLACDCYSRGLQNWLSRWPVWSRSASALCMRRVFT